MCAKENEPRSCLELLGQGNVRQREEPRSCLELLGQGNVRQRERTEILSRTVRPGKCAPKRTNRDLVSSC